jgi:hypothetical protein
MRAPVYRNIEAQHRFLGLAFPQEVIPVLGVLWFSMLLLPLGAALGLGAGTYALLRVATHGKAPHHLQHWALWHLRAFLALGRFSAAARSRTPRFPFAPHRSHFSSGRAER